MFTNLFYRALALSFSQSYASVNFTLKNHAGNDTTTTSCQYYSSPEKIVEALMTFNKSAKGGVSANNVITFGDGDAPVTADDYQLSGNYFTNYSGAYGFNRADNGECTWTYTLTNNGDSAFTIREVGLYVSAASNTRTALIMRELLAEPVTIAPGGVGQVTLKFKVNTSD